MELQMFFVCALLLVSMVTANATAEKKRQIKSEATNDNIRRLVNGVKPNPTRLGEGFDLFTDNRNKHFPDDLNRNELHSSTSFLTDEHGERQLLRDRDEFRRNPLLTTAGFGSSGLDGRGFGFNANRGLAGNLGGGLAGNLRGGQFLGTPVVYVPNLGYGYLMFPGHHGLVRGFGNQGNTFSNRFGGGIPFGNTFGARRNQFGIPQFAGGNQLFGGNRIQPGLTVLDPRHQGQTIFDGTTKLSTPIIVSGDSFGNRS